MICARLQVCVALFGGLLWATFPVQFNENSQTGRKAAIAARRAKGYIELLGCIEQSGLGASTPNPIYGVLRNGESSGSCLPHDLRGPTATLDIGKSPAPLTNDEYGAMERPGTDFTPPDASSSDKKPPSILNVPSNDANCIDEAALKETELLNTYRRRMIRSKIRGCLHNIATSPDYISSPSNASSASDTEEGKHVSEQIVSAEMSHFVTVGEEMMLAAWIKSDRKRKYIQMESLEGLPMGHTLAKYDDATCQTTERQSTSGNFDESNGNSDKASRKKLHEFEKRSGAI